jgi:hypothetical protein
MGGIVIPLCQVEKIIAYRKKNVKRAEKKLCGSKRIPMALLPVSPYFIILNSFQKLSFGASSYNRNAAGVGR